mmetsp:Transcript_47240/g.54528  ORF Transcript_47240/g.54528 Transcript_47240/m.54528 type:complete len:453 (+) Transcript_47240:103-1461(+)
MADSSSSQGGGSPANRINVDESGGQTLGNGKHKPTKEFSADTNQIVTMVYRIDNFATLVDKKVKLITTNAVKGCDHLWKIQVYPRGHDKSNTKDKYVCIGLVYAGDHDDTDPVTAKAVLRTKTESRDIPRHDFTKQNYDRTFPNFAKRKDILKKDCDKHGTLLITVELQVATREPPVWFPQLTHNNIATDLYDCTETSDVTFIIGTSGMEFVGHKCILYRRSRDLYELVKKTEEASTASSFYNIRVVLESVDETSFEVLLRYIYTGNLPPFNNNNDNENGNDVETVKLVKLILITADQFSCTEIKLYMESILIEKFLVVPTAASLLLFANTHSCALLKELCIEMYASNSQEVMEANSSDWTKLKESNDLLIELLMHTNNFGTRKRYSSIVGKNTATGIHLQEEQIDKLDVTSLREHLQHVGLDMDGSAFFSTTATPFSCFCCCYEKILCTTM